MNTTNLFVELIVIGVGAFIWLTLIILSLFGFSWIPTKEIFSTFFAIPILAIIYVLGIVTDRLADAVFNWLWSDDLRGSFFKNIREYYNSRRLILTKSERLSDLLEYGRSRLRICRGWTFNLIIILFTFNAFIWSKFYTNPQTFLVSIITSICLLIFMFFTWFSWRNLVLNEYRKIKEQAEFINKLSSKQ